LLTEPRSINPLYPIICSQQVSHQLNIGSAVYIYLHVSPFIVFCVFIVFLLLLAI